MATHRHHLKCNGEKFGGIGMQLREIIDQYLVDQLLTAALLYILDYLQYDFAMAVDCQNKSLADTILYILRNASFNADALLVS